jgi:hypothetical protein
MDPEDVRDRVPDRRHANRIGNLSLREELDRADVRGPFRNPLRDRGGILPAGIALRPNGRAKHPGDGHRRFRVTALDRNLDSLEGEDGKKGKRGDRDDRQLEDDARPDRKVLFQPALPIGEIPDPSLTPPRIAKTGR